MGRKQPKILLKQTVKNSLEMTGGGEVPLAAGAAVRSQDPESGNGTAVAVLEGDL